MKKFVFLFAVLFLALVVIIKKPFLSKSPESQIYGLIVPHHALAAKILDDSFLRIKNSREIGRVVVYGTNHYFPISETYTTSIKIKNKYDLNNIYASDERIEKEHSIQTIMPYINKYMPDAEIIPIIVSERFESFEKLEESTEMFLNLFGQEGTLYVASVDFAHNVSLEEGLNKNDESIKSIISFNFGDILKYTDDHMDSPVAIVTLLLTMQKAGATLWETWYSTHGGLIENDINLNGTSYVVGVFIAPIRVEQKFSYKPAISQY